MTGFSSNLCTKRGDPVLSGSVMGAFLSQPGRDGNKLLALGVNAANVFLGQSLYQVNGDDCQN